MIDQIAAEAVKQLIGKEGVSARYYQEHNQAIIKSAIEKALKWQRDYYGYVLPSPLSRAAHASEVEKPDPLNFDEDEWNR